VDSLESARARALLLHASPAGWLADHTALCHEDDVTVGELLLELAGESTYITIKTASVAHRPLLPPQVQKKEIIRLPHLTWTLWKALS
jgi:hypothetical protein